MKLTHISIFNPKVLAQQAKSDIKIIREKFFQTLIIGFASGFAVTASAQTTGIGSTITGLCKITSFVSDYLAFAILAVAIACVGVLYTMDAAREGVMAASVRIMLGSGAAISAVALVGYFLGKSVC